MEHPIEPVQTKNQWTGTPYVYGKRCGQPESQHVTKENNDGNHSSAGVGETA